MGRKAKFFVCLLGAAALLAGAFGCEFKTTPTADTDVSESSLESDDVLEGNGDEPIGNGEREKEYVVTYRNTKGAANPNPVRYTTASASIIFQPLQTEGYVFLGWEYEGIAQGSAGDRTVAALWGVTVTFDTQGGAEIAPAVVEEGKCLSAPPPPQKPSKQSAGYKTDYVFSHWTYEGEPFDFSVPLTQNVTLVASYVQWLTKA